MEDVIMTFAFGLLALIGLIIRVIIPLVLIIIGAVQLKKNNKKLGKILLIIGIIYLILSIAYFIYSGIVYGW